MKKRKKASKSPCQLSLAYLRKQGWVCGITERFNRFANIRQDLWGFVDIMAVRQGELLAVQTTSTPHLNDHLAKLRSEKVVGNVRLLLSVPGCRVVLHGWALRGDRGKRKTFTLKEIPVTLETLNDGPWLKQVLDDVKKNPGWVPMPAKE